MNKTVSIGAEINTKILSHEKNGTIYLNLIDSHNNDHVTIYLSQSVSNEIIAELSKYNTNQDKS